MDKNLVPRAECLKDTVERVLPYWYDVIVPEIKVWHLNSDISLQQLAVSQWINAEHMFNSLKARLTISVLHLCSAVTTEYVIPNECAAKLTTSFQVHIWGPNMILWIGMLYIFGKYDNQ